MRAAGAAGRQPPAHGGQVIEDALAEERLALPRRALVAQDRPLAPEGEVLRSVRSIIDAAADEPDAVAAAELGHDDAAREELAQGVTAVATCRPAQQPQLLRHAQAGAAPQERLQRVAVGVAERADARHPGGDATRLQVGERPRLTPEAVVVDGRRGVHHYLLLEAEPLPVSLSLRSPRRRCRSRGERVATAQSLAGHREADVLTARHEVDDIAADRAAEAVPALGRRIDVQVGSATVVVEGTAADQGAPARLELDAVAHDDVGYGTVVLDGLHVVAAGRQPEHQSVSWPAGGPRRRRGDGEEVAPLARPVSSAACRAASSRGAVVARRCSAGLASMVSATWLPRAKNSPSPFAALSRNCRSSGESWKATTTGSIVALSCRISSLIAALVSTVRPCSAPRKSAT